MNFLTDHLLTWILFIPTVGAALLLFVPGGKVKFIRIASLVISVLPLLLTLYLWSLYQSPYQAGTFRFEENYPWFTAINSSYHLGIDGVSLAMLLLTTILTPLAILTSFNIKERVKAFMILFLVLETGMLGVFMALDLLLFFVFWEIGLVPMYFLINHWCGGKSKSA